MTYSGCSSGASGGGDNLNTSYIDDFADYLTEVYRISSSENLARLSDVSVSNKQFNTTLPGRSITTFIVSTTDSSPTPAPTDTPSGNLGDVNNDGTITIIDALLTARYYVDPDPETFDPSLADVNCNGSIDIIDALLMAQYYVELITVFPCP
jgi:hypothetical protein